MKAIATTPSRHRASSVDGLVSNGIIASLLATEYKRLLPKLERVKLNRGDVLYRPNQRIDAVYFLEEAVVTMVDSLRDGRTIEVGTIGREGMVGINLFLAGVVTPDRAIVLLSGGAIRMKSKDFRHELSGDTALRHLLLAYARAFLAVLSQSVACSQHHTLQQRLARWLLTISDHSGSCEFQMVQRSIADMLGVRRERITEAASKFQSANLISYSRGRINVLDGPGLGRRSCECYRFIRRQYSRLHADEPQAPYRK
jgi:CRP-like cAMP-binding protein